MTASGLAAAGPDSTYRAPCSARAATVIRRRLRAQPRRGWRTVPVLYLDPGFPANLADAALRVTQILRKSDDSRGPTPAASTTRSQV